jgi:AFG3 family protein
VYVFEDAPPSAHRIEGGGAPAGAPPGPSTHRYTFQIGSIDSFERHLEEAQRSFGWSAEDFVPVIYTNPDVSLFDEFLKFAPTLLIIGALIWTTRSTMRGLGGMGAGGRRGRNIFNVGKAQVRSSFACLMSFSVFCQNS